MEKKKNTKASESKKVTKSTTARSKPKTKKREGTVTYSNGRSDIQVPAVKIKVVGIGGGGNNAVSRMNKDFIRGVEFIALNTDVQDLEKTGIRRCINIGRNLTKGMGAGMNPDVGKQSAEESRSEIIETLQGADLVFLTAGMGGGTGTGATPIVAECAREVGALTVAVVTKPFAFEGAQRSRIAEDGINKLRDKVDALIVIPNERIFSIIGNDTPVMKAFMKVDEVLKNTVSGISEVITSSGLVNVDFADIRAIMQGAGVALVGVGIASGADRAVKAATQAVRSQLLERSIDGAHGILFGISGGVDLKMSEVNEAARIITENADPSAKIIFGAYYDRKLAKGNIKINLIATGFNGFVTQKEGEKETAVKLGSISTGSASLSDLSMFNTIPESMEKDKPTTENKIKNLFGIGNEKDFKEAKLPPMESFEHKKPVSSEPEDDEDNDDMFNIPSIFRRKKK